MRTYEVRRPAATASSQAAASGAPRDANPRSLSPTARTAVDLTSSPPHGRRSPENTTIRAGGENSSSSAALVNVSAPVLDVATPVLDVSGPVLDVSAPVLDVSAPVLDASAAAPDVSAPPVDVPAPANMEMCVLCGKPLSLDASLLACSSNHRIHEDCACQLWCILKQEHVALARGGHDMSADARSLRCPHRACRAQVEIDDIHLFCYLQQHPPRDDGPACCICTLTINEDDAFRPECDPKHVIHESCAINMWAVQNREDNGSVKQEWSPYIRCPICRRTSVVGDTNTVESWKRKAPEQG